MDLKIKKHNFTIPEINVHPVLDELTRVYPNKVELNYESAASNLQYFLWALGWHVRIWLDNSIFTISRLYEDSPKIDNEDPILTLTCLSKYMSDDSYVIIEINGKETIFEKNKTVVQSSNDESIQQEVVKEDEIINIEYVNLEETSIKEVINKPIKKKGRPKRST